MSQLDPANTSVLDICTAALLNSGAIGKGQAASSEDINIAWARLQWLTQEWLNKRWLVYNLVTKLVTSTGQQTYTVGPGGEIDTGTGTMRPDKIESAFLRQLTQSQPNQIDYPLGLLQSMEDYNRIALKQLKSFPGWVFYDPSWPLGTLYVWPVMQANIYATGITIKNPEGLPVSFATSSTLFSIPYVYYNALVMNLALDLRIPYQVPSYPGDMLPGRAKATLNTLRGANTAIAKLTLPDFNRPGIYNIFSDRTY